MNIAITITAFPPSIGGAQIHTKMMAKELIKRNPVKVFTFWDQNRTDWLLGATLRLQKQTYKYSIEGIEVTKIGLPFRKKVDILPSVISYLPLQQKAIYKISQVFADEMLPHFGEINLIHNVRVGREHLSYASYELAKRMSVPFIFTPLQCLVFYFEQ